MVATTLAKPQYGQQSIAPDFASAQASVSHGGWANQGIQQQHQSIRPAGQSVPQVTPEEWAALSPYGTNINAYPAEERPRIEEIQRQWMSFLEYLPWLSVSSVSWNDLFTPLLKPKLTRSSFYREHPVQRVLPARPAHPDPQELLALAAVRQANVIERVFNFIIDVNLF